MSELKVGDKRFSSIEDRIKKMQSRANEFGQSRSNYMLAKFMGEDEYTPITKFKHIAHNSYVTMQEIRRMVIEKERKEREITRKQELFEKHKNGDVVFPLKEDEHPGDYDLDIYELTRQLEDIEIRIKGLSQEVDYMESLCDQLEKQNGKPFTTEQYQKEEPLYWQTRIAKQMYESAIGQKFGIGEGNIRSLLQSAAEPILNDKQQVPLFNFTNLNEIALLAFREDQTLKNHLIPQSQPEPPNKETPEIPN